MQFHIPGRYVEQASGGEMRDLLVCNDVFQSRCAYHRLPSARIEEGHSPCTFGLIESTARRSEGCDRSGFGDLETSVGSNQ